MLIEKATELPRNILGKLENREMKPKVIRNYLTNRVIPLVIEEDERRWGVEGTGAIFRFNSDLYFITARHVLNGVDYSKIGIPMPGVDSVFLSVHKVENGSQYKTFRNLTVYTFKKAHEITLEEEQHDLGLLKIKDKRLIDQIEKSGWKILGLENLQKYEKKAIKKIDYFIVAGYLKNCYENLEGKNRHHPLFVLKTNMIKPPEDTCYNTRYDRFFNYGSEIDHNLGGEVKSPHLEGISGSIIWSVTNGKKKKVLRPDNIFKVHSFECSMGSQHSYIRGKSLNLLQDIFGKYQSSIGCDIRRKI